MKTTFAVAMLFAGASAEDLTFNKKATLQAVEGILHGVLDGENLQDYVECTVVDGKIIASDLKQAMQNIEKKSAAGYAQAAEDLGQAFSTISNAINLCSKPADLAQLHKFEEAVKIFAHPKELIIHAGLDFLMNGQDILKHLENALEYYKADNKMEKFGEELGLAIDELFIGELKGEQITIDPRVEKSAKIVKGILYGAIKAEGLDNIDNCIQDFIPIAEGVEESVELFEKGGATNVLDAIIELAKTLKGVQSALTACRAVSADFAKLDKMIQIINSPRSFAYHTGKDLLINGVQIYHNIDDGITAYREENWEAFGENVGMGLAKLLLGESKAAQENNFFLY